MTDWILKNGLVYDGMGKPPYRGCIGIKGDRIEWIGEEPNLSDSRVIDLDGLIVAPGFIDSHTHAEGYYIDTTEPFLGKIRQGVTTELFGHCGLSVFPNESKEEHEIRNYFGPFAGPYQLDWSWRDLETLKTFIEKQKPITNVGTLVGHGSLRIAAMGFADRKPNAKEIETMISLLNIAFDEGAVGLSLGLMYPPGLYAELDELVALARVAAKRDRVVTSHMRNETFYLLDSVQEMVRIANLSGARMVISHHKAVGKQNWGKILQSLSLIDDENTKGVDIRIDVYPYTVGNTMLRSLLPPWVLEGGIPRMLERLSDMSVRNKIRSWVLENRDWENLSLAGGWDSIVILSTKDHPEYKGRNLEELALESGKEPVDFMIDTLYEDEGQTVILLFTACEEDLVAAMRKPYCMVMSDGIPTVGMSHPRLYGSFPRFLSKYVRELRLMSFEEGIRRITCLPAETYGLKDRGILRKNAFADIVVFNPALIRDQATYQKPDLMPEGIEFVFVNGQLSVENGLYNSKRSGKFI